MDDLDLAYYREKLEEYRAMRQEIGRLVVLFRAVGAKFQRSADEYASEPWVEAVWKAGVSAYGDAAAELERVLKKTEVSDD